MVADSLTKALNRIDAKLEAGLVPPLARMPLGTTTRRDLPSSMLSWRLEEEGSLLHSESGSANPALQLGMNAETVRLSLVLYHEYIALTPFSLRTVRVGTHALARGRTDHRAQQNARIPNPPTPARNISDHRPPETTQTGKSQRLSALSRQPQSKYGPHLPCHSLGQRH